MSTRKDQSDIENFESKISSLMKGEVNQDGYYGMD